MDFDVFDNPRPEVDAAVAARIVQEHYWISGIAEPLAGERDRSFKIEGETGTFVLKVGNGADRSDALEAQGAAVEWALAGDPDLPLAAVVRNRSGELSGDYDGHQVQLTRFIAGAAPPGSGSPPGLRRSVGVLAAQLSRALRGFNHPALRRRFPWVLAQLPGLAPLLDYLPAERRSLVAETMARFEQARPRLERLPHQATHGDLNPDNMVVDPADSERIVGVFDFGDLGWAPRVIELAVAAAYQSFHSDPVTATAQVAAAYHLEDPLWKAEVELIPDLVAARCAQSLLMSARHVAVDGTNRDYATGDDHEMSETLTRLMAADHDDAVARIAAASGFSPTGDRSFADALALRRHRIGPSLHLSYDDPVHLARGEGVWLIDTNGRRLLDGYNNVPHVGHSHPSVVAALAAQSRRLTTNTRYLVDGVAEYADRLVGLMPDPLSVVLFVNSGSEANDVAYRIAQAVTGRRGVITTENAYHGATAFTAAISPEELGDTAREPWAAAIGGAALLGDPSAAVRVTPELQSAQEELTRRGEAAAMVILDTSFSSDGIFDVPQGMLGEVRAWADANGALLVADEVQAGFGRVGRRFWGFAADSAVPDIVTLGKPIGNGYPMGAIVTTEEIAAEFAAKSHFFSTFAGSPVAAAVGTAVIDVVESEALASNADDVGGYLREQIAAIDSSRVVDVRGPGLFVGVELESRELAVRTVNDLRHMGVLIGSTGPHGRVLKIRPPLVCTRHHADIIVEALAASLATP